MKTKELLYQVLACNCHRLCLIFLVLIMISRKPKNKHLQIHKSSSHDTFDRYKIPLLKGDTLFDVFFQISASESHPQYNPQKYPHTPIQS